MKTINKNLRKLMNETKFINLQKLPLVVKS